MSDLTKQDYRKILYEELGMDKKLEELEKSEKEGTVGSSSQGTPGDRSVSTKGESKQTA